MPSPTLVNCSFGVVSLIKNADTDKYKYSRYEIGFDRGNVKSVGNGFGRNVIIFGVDMSSSVHVDNKAKGLLILGKRPTQGLGEHWLTAEKCIHFTDHSKKYCFNLHYNGANSNSFVNDVEMIKFKAKDSEIVATPLCLCNCLKDRPVDNMKEMFMMDIFMILVLIMILLPLMIF